MEVRSQNTVQNVVLHGIIHEEVNGCKRSFNSKGKENMSFGLFKSKSNYAHEPTSF